MLFNKHENRRWFDSNSSMTEIFGERWSIIDMIGPIFQLINLTYKIHEILCRKKYHLVRSLRDAIAFGDELQRKSWMTLGSVATCGAHESSSFVDWAWRCCLQTPGSGHTAYYMYCVMGRHNWRMSRIISTIHLTL